MSLGRASNCPESDSESGSDDDLRLVLEIPLLRYERVTTHSILAKANTVNQQY